MQKILRLLEKMHKAGKSDNKKKFNRILEQLNIDAEEERLLAEAPAVPHVQPLEDHEIEKNMNETVNTIL